MDARRTRRDLGLIVLACTLTFFAGLGQPLLWDRDEPRNAGCAREMLQRGDWIVPTFNDQLRSQKPVLTYWLMMTTYLLFGINEFAARFSSALLGTLTVLTTYWAGRRLFDGAVGFWSAIILCSSVMFVVASRAATPDAALIFFTSAALLWFAVMVISHWPSRGAETSAPSRPVEALSREGPALFFRAKWQAAVFYALLGLAVLAKGPVGFVLPLAIVGLWIWTMRVPRPQPKGEQQGFLGWTIQVISQWMNPRLVMATLREMRPALGAVVVLTVAAPWYIAVGIQTEFQFLHEFLWRENLARATTTFENHHGGWWYYPLALLIGFFPWSVFAVPMVSEIDRVLSRRRDPILVFLVHWVVIQVFVFSLARTKLPSYVTPCYPALALLFGWGLTHWRRGVQRAPSHFYRWGLVAAAYTGIVLAVVAGWGGIRYLEGEWRLIVIGIPLIAGGGFGWYMSRLVGAPSHRAEQPAKPLNWHLRLSQPAVPLATFSLACIAFVVVTFGWGAVRVSQTRRDNAVLQAIRQAPREARVFAYRCLESSWVFYGGRPIVELSEAVPSAPSATSPWGPKQTYWQTRGRPYPEDVAVNEGYALIVTTERFADELVRRLPGHCERIAVADYFGRTDRMVLFAVTSHRSAQGSAPTASLSK